MTGQPQRRRLARALRLIPQGGARIAVRRIRWILGIYGLVLVLVLGQLVHIQVVHADEYADASIRQRERTIELSATRGRIYDRDGDVLATSVESATIYGDPRAFLPRETADGMIVPPAAHPREVAETLAPLLDRDVDVLTERLSSDAHFVYLARQVDHDIGDQIRDLGLPGIGILSEPSRIYPGGSLAAQIVGFTDIDGHGLQGIEAHHDEILKGKPGQLMLERAPGGLDIASGVRELVPSQVGTDVVLTIDRDIQHAAEVAAAEAVEAFDALAASIVALDVATGEVLAMASAPGFDPNHRVEGDSEAWRNRAITDIFEPGSTQKALTIAAAIDQGLITPTTQLTVPDNIRVASSTFTDASTHPETMWTVEQIMERSSNVGTIQIAQRLGEQRLDSALRDFGLGSPTGVGFPGEAAGMLMHHDEWWATSLPTISIGHGVAVTLMQMASAYATIANDGVAVQPSIVRGHVGGDGRLAPVDPAPTERVIQADTAEQVQQMLVRAVTGEDGTGKLATVSGYQVAGKTGTARKPAVDGGYSEEYIATFTGFAPADDPQIVVAVMVDEPTPIWGGVVAAPVFSQVMEAALISRRIAPDQSSQSLAEAIARAHTSLQQIAEVEMSDGQTVDVTVDGEQVQIPVDAAPHDDDALDE